LTNGNFVKGRQFCCFQLTYSKVPSQIEGSNFCCHLIHLFWSWDWQLIQLSMDSLVFSCNEVEKNAFSDRLACDIDWGNDCKQIGEFVDASKVHAALYQTPQVPDNCMSGISFLGSKA